MYINKRVGLALSGGGYRAAAFHLGTLKKLHELDILPQIDVLSTVSGGSITGAYYCLKQGNFAAFEEELKQKLATKSVIHSVVFSWTGLRALAYLAGGIGLIIYCFQNDLSWLAAVVGLLFCYGLIRFQFSIFPISRQIEWAYNDFFYKGVTLKDLPDRPILAIASTNLQTCRPFTFSKKKMEDSFYAYQQFPIRFHNDDFPLARAVVASSCVPFAFSPVRIDREYFKKPEQFDQVRPYLVDGGIYDNQGIQKLSQPGSSYECDVIITSDAGNKLPFEGSYTNTFTLLLRTVETFMTRIKNFQMAQHLFDAAKSPAKDIAYLSLGWDVEKCLSGFFDGLKAGRIPTRLIEAHQIPEDWLADLHTHKKDVLERLQASIGYSHIINEKVADEDKLVARSVSTNLTKLSPRQIDCLMRHAANITEIQVRLYCPSLILTQVGLKS
ncbi:patatin-like phospholipase family protein (plasmid) [Fibrella sp. ES10-3-2-2]